MFGTNLVPRKNLLTAQINSVRQDIYSSIRAWHRAEEQIAGRRKLKPRPAEPSYPGPGCSRHRACICGTRCLSQRLIVLAGLAADHRNVSEGDVSQSR